MNIILLVGRIIFGGYFLFMGINHFLKLNSNTGYAQSKGIIFPKFSVIITGILLALGGLGIVLGMYVNIALLFLVLFLIPTTILMHNFWKETEPGKRNAEMYGFLKNMALLGAIIMMYAMYANDWSYVI